jgi:hypothetical protein
MLSLCCCLFLSAHFFESLINACQVYSPFELDCKRPASLGLFDIPNISIIDWESLDYSVWATCRSLLLLPPEIIEVSMKIPFSKEKHVSHIGSVFCGNHCDVKSPSDKDKKADAESDNVASITQELSFSGPQLMGRGASSSCCLDPNSATCDAEDVVPHAAGGKLFEASADPSASKDDVIDGGAVSMSPADEHTCSDQMIT